MYTWTVHATAFRHYSRTVSVGSAVRCHCLERLRRARLALRDLALFRLYIQ